MLLRAFHVRENKLRYGTTVQRKIVTIAGLGLTPIDSDPN